jgi:flagellar motility protein MotE (MotC chaperone)/sporulation protein YlmC with PRC-barrel domain
VSTTPTRVFAARLAGLPVFDPQGDQVGKVRDVVVVMRPGASSLVSQPRVGGLVVEVFGRRQIFAPMTRITSIDAGQVITTGLLNMRRFAKRSTETLVIGQMLDQKVTVRGTEIQGVVFDVAMEQTRSREWVLSRVAIQEPTKGFRRRGQTHVAEWRDVEGLARSQVGQGAVHLVAALADLRPADAATVIHDLPPERRSEVVAALDDERLADVLEELPAGDQVEILEHLDSERAADVLEEMSADDAADLIADLPPETAATLLGLMEPEEAEDVRRLMSYEERTAGGMMTTEPVILPPDATVADALAHVRNVELSPSLAALVYVVRPPLEPPTGRLLGVAHIQRLQREPPSTMVGHVLDTDIEPLRPTSSLEDCARHLATYNLVAAPVVDEDGRLVGAVTVDDLLDHLLPENWRDTPSRTSAAVRIGGTSGTTGSTPGRQGGARG